MNDGAIKLERCEESPTEDEENLTETAGLVTTESSAMECSTMSAAEQDVSPLVQVNRETQIEDTAVQNSCKNVETQPDDSSLDNEDIYQRMLKDIETAVSQHQPDSELVARVNAEPSDTTESTVQLITKEDNLGKTLENPQTSSETAGPESSAMECSTMSAAEHDVSPLVQVNRETQIKDTAVLNSCENVETQPDDSSLDNEDIYQRMLKDVETAVSQHQPDAELVARVNAEPSDTTESTVKLNTKEDNLGKTLENPQTSSEPAGPVMTPQADNATPLISTEPTVGSPFKGEAAGAAITLVESKEDPSEPTTVDSMTGTRPENETHGVEQTSAQSVIEAIIPSASKAATVSVKPEPDSDIQETIPDDFFDDLLDNADQLTADLSPMHVDGVEPELNSQTANDVSEATQSAECINSNVYNTDRNVPNQASHSERIRIKNEPNSLGERNEASVGDEQDFIPTPRSSPQRSGVEETPSVPQIRVKNELNQEVSACNEEVIPDNFFDDLLDDHVATRVACMEYESQEIKYAEQLKEIRDKLRRLEETGQDSDDAREKSNSSSGHKHKSKKSKKKSRKRAKNEKRKASEALADNGGESRHSSSKRRRSRSKTREQELSGIETPHFNINYGNLPKVPLPPPPVYRQTASTLTAHVQADSTDDVMFFPKPIMVKPEPSVNFEPIPLYADDDNEDEDFDCLPVRSSSKRTTVEAANTFSGFKKIKLEKPASEPAEPLILTPAMKRQKALRLAAETIKQFHGAKHQSSFYFASTVRKLPTSSSFVTQQSYENRSPLHTIHNVRYTFNSHSTRFNLHEWGLEALPKIAAKVARIVGCDADTLCAKLQSAKLSTKYNKIKREPDDNGELIDETKSSFFTNAMTQTDDVYVLTARRRNANDIGVQVSPISGDIATQTTASSSSITNTNDDLPLMQLINVLNENQLLALNDFAELIREPADTALDMYRLRTRMQEIYKCSQLPSAMPAATIAAAPARIYETSPRSLPNHQDYRQQSTHRLATRDPRASSSSNIAHFATHAQFRPDLRVQGDPRLNPAAIQQQRQLHPLVGIPPTKSYGRGSVRR